MELVLDETPRLERPGNVGRRVKLDIERGGVRARAKQELRDRAAPIKSVMMKWRATILQASNSERAHRSCARRLTLSRALTRAPASIRRRTTFSSSASIRGVKPSCRKSVKYKKREMRTANLVAGVDAGAETQRRLDCLWRPSNVKRRPQLPAF
jgi:hypothetical protein